MRKNHTFQTKKMLRKLLICSAISLIFINVSCTSDSKKPIIVQEPLPFLENSLAPHISAKTMKFHYTQHYAKYVKRTENLLNNSGVRGKSLEEIIKETYGKKKHTTLFNNAAQAWNHAFFWKCLKPNGNVLPHGKLKELIKKSFGGHDSFKKEVLKASNLIIGSGWIWVVQDKSKLKIIATSNADTPIVHAQNPIFTIDVWEHAYYLDYQNRRSDYITAVLDKITNWEFVAAQLK